MGWNTKKGGMGPETWSHWDEEIRIKWWNKEGNDEKRSRKCSKKEDQWQVCWSLSPLLPPGVKGHLWQCDGSSIGQNRRQTRSFLPSVNHFWGMNHRSLRKQVKLTSVCEYPTLTVISDALNIFQSEVPPLHWSTSSTSPDQPIICNKHQSINNSGVRLLTSHRTKSSTLYPDNVATSGSF